MSVGDVARTIDPLPVAAAAKAVPTPVPRPVMPAIGRPVALVNVTDVGVPSTGVTRVGDVANTIDPVPVTAAASAVPTPVPKPVKPAIGNPVAFVKVPDDGTPRAGVVNAMFVAAMPLGSVDEIDGTPPELVTKTPLVPVPRPATVVPVAEYHASWLMVPAETVPPPPPVVQTPPASTRLAFASIETQCPFVSVPFVVPKTVVLPDRLPTVGTAPAPPPITGAFRVRTPDDAKVPVAV